MTAIELEDLAAAPSADELPPGDETAGASARRLPTLRPWHLFVLYPVLATAATLTSAPGTWIADARLEFSVDPTGFLAGHGHLWDATRGMGNTTTWYSPAIAIFQALLQQLGAEPWLIERLLHAALLSIAALGIVTLLRVTAPQVGALHLLAGLIYAFNPFTAQYLVPSGLFLSYALAPWLLACFLRGIRERDDDWRMAAGFALCVFAHGALNSAALLYALLPVPIAALFVVVAERSIQLRLVVAWLLRAVVLSVLVASGAVVVLWFQRGDIGLNLATTEQQSVVSSRSSWAESWRGLGFWLTYFRDARGPLRPQSASYFQNPLVAVAAYAAPLAAGLSLTLSRWRPRWFFAALVALGMIMMVGVWPPSAPSPFGRALDWGFEHAAPLRGLRTTYKSGSLVALGVAALAAFGIVGLIRSRWSGSGRLARHGPRVAGWSLFGLVALSAYPFWTGHLYAADDGYDEIPAYWDEAIGWLNAEPGDGRVLVLPGVVRTPYRWGYVNDNLFHGLLEKSLVMEQSIPPPGTPLAADVALALDEYLSAPGYREGTIGPILRHLGVRWVVFQNDVDWQRVGVPRPAHFDALRADDDLALARTFGAPGENTSTPFDIVAPLVGEQQLAPVEVYEVLGSAAGTIRVEDDPAILVSGGGDAWPQLAEQGLLDVGPVAYTGTLSTGELVTALAGGSPVVVTDGARRRYTRVAGGLVSFSHTLSLEETSERDPRSPFESADATSVVEYADALAIEASRTGNGAIPFDPAQRPALAFDGVAGTAWEVSGPEAEGATLTVRLRAPSAVDEITVQTEPGPLNRVVGRIRVELITASGTDVTASASVGPEGRAGFTLGAPDVTEIRLHIEQLDDRSGVAAGITEVEVTSGGRRLDLREFVRTPRDLERAAASDADLAARLGVARVSYSFGRQTGTVGIAGETEMRRRFWAPASSSVDATGTLRITDATPDITVDRLVGAPVGAYASHRAAAPDSWGVNAVDGDVTTSWLGPPSAGETLTVRPPQRAIESVQFLSTLAEDVTGNLREFSSIDAATITARPASGEPVIVDVERDPQECAVRAGGLRACTATISADLPPGVYDTIELDLTEVDPIDTAFGPRPVAVSEVTFDGRLVGATELTVDDSGCVEGFTLDGGAVLVRTLGSRGLLLGQQAVRFESCEPVALTAGEHTFVSDPSWSGALSEVLLAPTGSAAPPATTAAGIPSVVVVERSPTRIVLDVTAPAGSTLIGPGSFHAGWRATVAGTPLGPAVPRDAQSAWQLPALDSARVELWFRPQRAYELALAVSVGGIAVCLTLLVAGRRR